MRRRVRTTFQSLTVRNYRLFASGQLVKLIGVWVMFVAQDWLVLNLSGDSAAALGLVTALQFTPVLLLTMLGGALADRYDKRLLLLAANGVWASLAILLAVLVVTGTVTLWHVYVLAAAMGTASAIETPVRQSFVSELVGNTLLPNALSLNAAVFNTARIVGPAIAGGAIALIGLGPTFAVATVAALSPLVSLSRMRPEELYRAPLPPRAERERTTVRDGLRYTWQRSDLVMAMALVTVVATAGFNYQVTLPLLSKVVHGTGAATFGLLATAFAIGSLAGALSGSWRRQRPSAYLVAGAAFGFGLFSLLVGAASAYWLVTALLVPTGFFAIFFAQAANQRVQMGCDPAYRGRVMALYVLFFLGTTPLGALAVGWWAERFGPPSAIWVGGLISLLAASAALVWQLRRHGDQLRLRLRPLPKLYVVRAAQTGAAATAGRT